MDFLDVLLEFEGDGIDKLAKISVIFILEIFRAGKAKLTQVIGPSRRIEESDIDNLPYLRGIIKETLRLHPPIPFLVPRKATHDTSSMGCFVPKDTQVFVNAYAIGGDPDVWREEPTSSKPERFVGSKTDYKGQNYELIPFGAGRRMCAGVPLAHRMLHLTLGMLLHRFDENVTRETMDWKDKLGMQMLLEKLDCCWTTIWCS